MADTDVSEGRDREGVQICNFIMFRIFGGVLARRGFMTGNDRIGHVESR